MTGLYLHPLRLRALDRMTVLRVPVTKQTSRCESCVWEYLDWKEVYVDPGLGAGPYLKASAKDKTIHRVYPRMEAGEHFGREAWGIEQGRYVQPFAEYPVGGRFEDEVFYKVDDPRLPGMKWQPARTMPEAYARYLLTLGPPVPCRLGR